jgi:hypothetical protein
METYRTPGRSMPSIPPSQKTPHWSTFSSFHQPLNRAMFSAVTLANMPDGET